MGTIVDLNSIASASLVKVDGIAMASLSKIASQTYSGGGVTSNPGRIAITIPAADIDSTLTNFPMCIHLNDTDQSELFQELTDGSVEGINAAYKLFIREGDATLMPTEVDICSVADGTIILHTLVPSISDTVDTIFYIDFNNQAADNTAGIGAVGSAVGQSVWDSDFEAVYHLNEAPVHLETNTLDSTSNGLNMISNNGSGESDLVDGWPGKGIEFNGTNQRVYSNTSGILTDYPATLEVAGPANIGAASNNCPALGIAKYTVGTEQITLNMYGAIARLNFYSGGVANIVDSVVTLSADEFVHMAAVLTNATDRTLITNGTDIVNDVDSDTWPAGINRISIGATADSTIGYRDGICSEVRFSGVARSDAWVETTYTGLADTLLSISDALYYEDLTTYTEVDINTDLTVSTYGVTVDSMERGITSYIYKDFGVDYFGDFVVEFECILDASDSQGNMAVCMLSNTIGSYGDIQDANDGTVVWVYDRTNSGSIFLTEYSTDNTADKDYGTDGIDPQYCRLTRQGELLTLELYSDAARTTLHATTRYITGVTTPYRYFYVVASRDSASDPTDVVNGYTRNFLLEDSTDMTDLEDLSTYTLVEPGTLLRVNDNRVFFRTYPQNGADYLYYDFGANYFGDFDIEFEAELVDSTDNVSQFTWNALSNTLGTQEDFFTTDGISCDWYNISNLYSRLRDCASEVNDSYNWGNVSFHTLTWFKWERRGTTSTLKLFSDATRSTLIDTLTLTCSTDMYRYYYAANGRGAGVSDTANGYGRNFKIIDPNRTQDLTTYTEVDSASDLTVTAPKVAFDTMDRGANSWVVYDFGADYFGDFEIQFESEITASQTFGLVGVIAVSDTAGTLTDFDVANDAMKVHIQNSNVGGVNTIMRDESNGNGDSLQEAATTTVPLRYYTFKRASTTLTLEIYSDSDRITLVDTLTLTCETGTKRYLHALFSWENGSGATITGYNQNFRIITAS